MKCNNCGAEMKDAGYTDGGIYATSEIYDTANGSNVEKRKNIGKLVYCPKCGNLQVAFKSTEN